MKSEKDIQVDGGIRESYDKLIKSGMAWEFHPWLTGNWNEDKDRYIKEIYEVYENRKD